ncbi:MAG: hypothetical protein GTO63_02160, partial [Anaerolineae bacterium]|nr:hypothetical protein [Anaerolineae bacterium]NIN93860.1 hypothetical protein [Anaerolineae bacterium]NIQ76893.1 hypothetical protein [Anaerolineae bacterium]
MQNRDVALAPLSRQMSIVKEILLANQVLGDVLMLCSEALLPNWYIGGGAVPQTVWNHYHGFDPNHEILDFDIIYFDDTDLTRATEEGIEKELSARYPDCPAKLDVTNEARAHLWYEQRFGKAIKPYTCTEDAIYSFPTTASAVGVTISEGGELEIYAPLGLTDLLGLVVRANKITITRHVYEEKCRRWKKAWPRVTVIPWE